MNQMTVNQMTSQLMHECNCDRRVDVSVSVDLYWILCNSPKLDLRKGNSKGPQSPLPHTLEPRVDECSLEVQSIRLASTRLASTVSI